MIPVPLRSESGRVDERKVCLPLHARIHLSRAEERIRRNYFHSWFKEYCEIGR